MVKYGFLRIEDDMDPLLDSIELYDYYSVYESLEKKDKLVRVHIVLESDRITEFINKNFLCLGRVGKFVLSFPKFMNYRGFISKENFSRLTNKSNYLYDKNSISQSFFRFYTITDGLKTSKDKIKEEENKNTNNQNE